MKLDEIEVGCYYRMRLGSDERSAENRAIWLTRWVWVEAVRLSSSSGRVTVRLIHFPQWRARSVKPDRLMA